VGGQHDSYVLVAVHPLDEGPDPLFDLDVQPDRRLVEVHDRRMVEERSCQLASHLLAEGQLPDRLVHELVQVEDVVELRHPLFVVLITDLVDLLEQGETLPDRQIPPELGLLAEDDADVHGVFLPVLVGHDAVDLDAAGCGLEDACEHLDGRGLAGAVGTDVPDHLAALDLEVQILDGVDLLVLPGEKGPDVAGQSLAALVDAEGLVDILCLDESHGKDWQSRF
jgi:hypothetical protein